MPENRLPHSFRQLPASIVRIDMDESIVIGCNPAVLQLNGYTENGLIGTSLLSLFDPFPRLNQATSCFTNLLTAGNQKLPVKFSYASVICDNEVCHIIILEPQNTNASLPLTSQDQLQEVDMLNAQKMPGVVWDISKQRAAIAEQVRLNKIVQESFNEIFLIHDRSLELEYVNPAALHNLGYTQSDLKALKLTDLFQYPDKMAIDALLNSLRNSTTDRLQLQLKFTRKNGSHYDVDVLIQVLEKDHSFMAIVTDITTKLITEKKLLDTITEKETLIKEIHHRVKNNLQLISSIIFLKVISLGESDIKDFLEDTRQKIRSIALIHERLLQTQTLDRVEIADYLGKLIQDLQITYQKPDLQLEIHASIESHTMHLDTAIICGLIVNELITNALKHAFKGRETGCIHVGFLYDRQSEKYALSIADNGVSLPQNIQPGSSTSFGMQLIDVFVKQLNGQFDIIRENGTNFQIRF